MGMFWDLLQQSQLSHHHHRTGAIEERVSWLEAELERTQQVLRAVIARLEQHVGDDIDSDGRVG